MILNDAKYIKFIFLKKHIECCWFLMPKIKINSLKLSTMARLFSFIFATEMSRIQVALPKIWIKKSKGLQKKICEKQIFLLIRIYAYGDLLE